MAFYSENPVKILRYTTREKLDAFHEEHGPDVLLLILEPMELQYLGTLVFKGEVSLPTVGEEQSLAFGRTTAILLPKIVGLEIIRKLAELGVKTIYFHNSFESDAGGSDFNIEYKVPII